MKMKFYDTSSLLLLTDNLFQEPFAISSITLAELEEIKNSSRKDADIKASARHLLHVLDANPGKYKVVIYNSHMIKNIESANLEINNDSKILASAIYYERTFAPRKMIFVTNDLAQKAIAGLFFDSGAIQSVEPPKDNYTGYKEMRLDDAELAELYQNLSTPPCDICINEYLIIRDKDNNIIDKMCWDGEKLRPVKYYTFFSHYLGETKPKSQDVYQVLAMDSLVNNQITMLKGPAGSGKTWLALTYLFHLLEKHKIDKIIIFCNTVATAGAAKLGYLPGSRDQKLLDSQIGNVLSSKLGDKMIVEKLVADGTLVLLPMSDARGYDTTGMRAGIFITEAQNLDINLMKLALQRIGDDSVCIIDGDPLTQVDDISFSGINNGMRKASKVFRNTDIYGEVELKNIHRSKIANIAQNM